MNKTQEFIIDGCAFQVESTYHPKENVWTSDYVDPYEWNTEREMRLDMLIKYLSEDNEEVIQFSLWNCRTEDEFLEQYNKYQYYINQY
jgi:hypothetical protein